MIWFRRTVAITLALIFIALSLVIVFAFRVTATVGNPDFYQKQLEKADVYNFIYDDLLPKALEGVGGGGSATNGSSIQELGPFVTEVARGILPPEWLQAQAEQVINELVPYIWEETESIDVSIPLKDRVEAGAQALRGTLHNEELFPSLYDQLLEIIASAIASQQEVPLVSDMPEEELAAILRIALPPAWVVQQLEGAIDAVVPYLTKEKEGFTVRVDISERLDALQVAVATILKRPEAYDYLLEGLILPVLEQNVGQITSLPLGLQLSGEEILPVAKAALPFEWYQEQVDTFVEQVFEYLRGTQGSIEVAIPLDERKPAIAAAIGNLADQKLEEVVDALPVCSGSQLLDLLLNPPLDRLPECRPLNLSYQELKALLGIDISALVTPLVDAMVPDRLLLTDAELNQMFGGGADEDVLSQIRDVVQQGLTFTDEDLGEMIGAESGELEDIRNFIAEGVTFTEQDLRQWVGGEEGDGGGSLQAFDEVRSALGTARTSLYFIWLLPLLMLAGIGALGGRQWSTRIIWAASSLLLMAVVSYILWGPVFSSLMQPRIGEAMMPLTQQAESVQGMLAAKGVTFVSNAIDSFVGGIKAQSLGILIGSALLIGAGIFWYYRTREE